MSEKNDPGKYSRRAFIKVSSVAGAGVATATIATSKEAVAEGLSVNAKKTVPKWTMVIDLKKCTGCKGCVIACKAENHTPPGVAYNVVMENEPEAVGMPFLFRPCMQCEKSSCVKVCPTGATHKRKDGIVAIDYDKCIGCRYCLTACPYNARSFDFGEYYRDGENGYRFTGNHDTHTYENISSPEYGEDRLRKKHVSPIGNARKCTFCLHRIYDSEGNPSGMKPACASTCQGRAIHFGDLNDPADPIHKVLNTNRGKMKLKRELGNKPSVTYLI